MKVAAKRKPLAWTEILDWDVGCLVGDDNQTIIRWPPMKKSKKDLNWGFSLSDPRFITMISVFVYYGGYSIGYRYQFQLQVASLVTNNVNVQ